MLERGRFVRSSSVALCLIAALSCSPLMAGGGDEAGIDPGARGSPAEATRLWTDRSSDSDWGDVTRTFRDVGFHVMHPTAREGLVYAAIAVSAYAAHQVKGEFADELQEDRTTSGDRIASTVRPLGEGVVPLLALGTYAIGRFSGSDSTRRAGLILSESAALTVLATEVGQYVFSEQRPSNGGHMTFFAAGGHGISGHTSIVASAAVPLDRLFFRVHQEDGGWKRAGKYFGKAVVYTLPVMTGWSRLNDNEHYAWNVVLGLGTGYVIGDLVASAHGLDGAPREKERTWSVTPVAGDRGGVGLGVTWKMH